jgi:hypothetical protein
LQQATGSIVRDEGGNEATLTILQISERSQNPKNNLNIILALLREFF